MKTKSIKESLIAALALNFVSLNAPAAIAAEAAGTNGAASATPAGGTNQSQNGPQDLEAAELDRLWAQSRTNQDVGRQFAALARTRYARLLQELKTSPDPVSVAIKMAQGRHVGVEEGIDELAKHWNDPRAEETLEALSKSGPHSRGDLGPTLYGKAYGRLLELRSHRQLEQITRGTQTEQQRVSAISAFLQSRPELMTPYPSPLTNTIIVRILFEDLRKSDDTGAVRLVLKSGQITPDFAKRHLQEMLEYARQVSPAEALTNPPLIEALDRLHDKAVIPIFEKWSSYATGARDRDYFARRLEALRREP